MRTTGKTSGQMQHKTERNYKNEEERERERETRRKLAAAKAAGGEKEETVREGER